MPLLFLLSLILQSNDSEMNVKGWELQPCPRCSGKWQRASLHGWHGPGGRGAAGRGKAKQDLVFEPIFVGVRASALPGDVSCITLWLMERCSSKEQPEVVKETSPLTGRGSRGIIELKLFLIEKFSQPLVGRLLIILRLGLFLAIFHIFLAEQVFSALAYIPGFPKSQQWDDVISFPC